MVFNPKAQTVATIAHHSMVRSMFI